MKISYAITVCNEFVEIQKLIPLLLESKRPEDEIIVLYDQKNGDIGVEEFLRAKSVNSAFACSLLFSSLILCCSSSAILFCSSAIDSSA